MPWAMPSSKPCALPFSKASCTASSRPCPLPSSRPKALPSSNPCALPASKPSALPSSFPWAKPLANWASSRCTTSSKGMPLTSACTSGSATCSSVVSSADSAAMASKASCVASKCDCAVFESFVVSADSAMSRSSTNRPTLFLSSKPLASSTLMRLAAA